VSVAFKCMASVVRSIGNSRCSHFYPAETGRQDDCSAIAGTDAPAQHSEYYASDAINLSNRSHGAHVRLSIT
jgi:hypothetical protein